MDALSFNRVFYQDFYSHSNWVEMGQHSIYLHLLQPEEPAIPVAKGINQICDYTTAHFITKCEKLNSLFLCAEDTPTCMECFSPTCRNNLLPRLTNSQQHSQMLTTGYFSTFPPKPQGTYDCMVSATNGCCPSKIAKEQVNSNQKHFSIECFNGF